MINCKSCTKFNKFICVEKHMGDKPEDYDKPQLMGCSFYKDPKGDVLTLFGEE